MHGGFAVMVMSGCKNGIQNWSSMNRWDGARKIYISMASNCTVKIEMCIIEQKFTMGWDWFGKFWKWICYFYCKLSRNPLGQQLELDVACKILHNWHSGKYNISWVLFPQILIPFQDYMDRLCSSLNHNIHGHRLKCAHLPFVPRAMSLFCEIHYTHAYLKPQVNVWCHTGKQLVGMIVPSGACKISLTTNFLLKKSLCRKNGMTWCQRI